MRLSGGADGMASVLQAKLFKSVMSVDLDPATIKGSADLRVDFPLDLKHIPDLPDLPVTLTGTLADLSVDKVMGKDRLEAGRFALSYDRGAFALKGDGRVAGAPDRRRPAPAQGRPARRGGGQPVRSTMPSGAGRACRARRSSPARSRSAP